MSSVSALGAVATLVSGAFGACTLERWRAHRRPHELAWTLSLAMFSVASAAYWSAGAIGWTDLNFRIFYLFGAILNVPYLALGTVYLLGGERLGRPIGRTLHLLAAFCAGFVFAAPAAPLPTSGLPEGREVFGVVPRAMAAAGSGIASIVLIGGALWSVWSLLSTRTRPARGAAPVIAPGRLAATNVLIATGSVVLGVGGSFFAETQREVGFGIYLVVGISILFAGFLISSPTPPAGGVRAPLTDPFMTELRDVR